MSNPIEEGVAEEIEQKKVATRKFLKESGGTFKINKKIFEKQGNLPRVDKRENTTFNEFKLSNPESTYRRKTLIEYQQDLEKMKRACFKARSFDK